MVTVLDSAALEDLRAGLGLQKYILKIFMLHNFLFFPYKKEMQCHCLYLELKFLYATRTSHFLIIFCFLPSFLFFYFLG